jgi:RNA polymerase sigma-70 factor (ECF subfamily)
MIAMLSWNEASGWRAEPEGGTGSPPLLPVPEPQVREVIASHFRVVWRALRRFGVRPALLDDAAQQVFATLVSKRALIEPGKERAFLLGVAFRVAANLRRAQARRPELALEDAELPAHPDPNPEELLELKRRRARLDEVLDALPEEQRAVFVLFELEGCSTSEIAEALELPMGTVASRLRRARGRFAAKVRELKKRDKGVGT